MIQLPVPPSPSGFVPLSFDWVQFVMFYIVGIEVVLLLLPKKWSRQILTVLFPNLRRLL